MGCAHQKARCGNGPEADLTLDDGHGLPSVGGWVPMGSAAVPPRARYDAQVVRLSRELFLILAEGRLSTEPGRDRQVGLYWAMDPVARYTAARGILESGRPTRVEAGSMVDPSLIHDTPPLWPEASCIPFSPDVDTLFIYGLSPQAELHEDPRAGIGKGPESGAVAPRLPSLGLLGHDALIEGADLHVSGTVSPAPIQRLGRCAVPSPSNWGAPLDASGPFKPITCHRVKICFCPHKTSVEWASSDAASSR